MDASNRPLQVRFQPCQTSQLEFTTDSCEQSLFKDKPHGWTIGLGLLVRTMVGSRGRCWSCGETLLPNEVAGVCPPCCWQWPSLADDGASCVLARERSGLPVFGLGFRLRQPTESVVHRMKYGGFPKHGQTLGMWMGGRWRAPPENVVLMPVPSHWRRVWRRGFGGRRTDHRRHVPSLPKVPDSGRSQRAGGGVARLGLIPAEMPV